MLIPSSYPLDPRATSLGGQLDTARALEQYLQQAWSGTAGLLLDNGLTCLTLQSQNYLHSNDVPEACTLLGSQPGALAKLTRTIVTWAARCRGGPPTCTSQIRALLAQMNLVARSLWLEPIVAETTHAEFLPRMALVEGMVTSRDILSWGTDTNYMRQALIKAITKDPCPNVRLSVLQAISLAPISRSWIAPLIDAVRDATATLAETPFSQFQRQTLAHSLALADADLRQRQAPLSGFQVPPGAGGAATAPPTADALRRAQQASLKRPLLLGALALAAVGGIMAGLRRGDVRP